MPDETTPHGTGIAATDDAAVPVRLRAWDFTLTAATVAVLAALGIQSFAGTLWVWWAQNADPAWASTGEPAFIAGMNVIAAPLVVVLVVLMGLCVPKRLISRMALVWASAGMLAAGIAAWLVTASLTIGLAVYLALASLIQVAVAVLTVAGVRGPSYLTEGRLTKTGSALLHLGFVVFGIVVVALQRSSFMLPVFWVAAGLIMVGTVLSFYADAFAVKRLRPAEPTAAGTAEPAAEGVPYADDDPDETES